MVAPDLGRVHRHALVPGRGPRRRQHAKGFGPLPGDRALVVHGRGRHARVRTLPWCQWSSFPCLDPPPRRRLDGARPAHPLGWALTGPIRSEQRPRLADWPVAAERAALAQPSVAAREAEGPWSSRAGSRTMVVGRKSKATERCSMSVFDREQTIFASESGVWWIPSIFRAKARSRRRARRSSRRTHAAAHS